MIELPNNIHVCTDCMQKSFNSMNRQFNDGKFNYSDLLNMPNVSMIDLSSFQNPVQQPEKVKKKKTYYYKVVVTGQNVVGADYQTGMSSPVKIKVK